MNLEDFKEKDIISIIYKSQEEKIDELLKKADKNVKEKLTKVSLEKIIKDNNFTEKLKEEFDKIEENYNIVITEYNKEIYKQGFIDGVNLILNCFKN